MYLDESIDKWLKEKYLYDYIKDEEIRLTDKQRFDINKIGIVSIIQLILFKNYFWQFYLLL